MPSSSKRQVDSILLCAKSLEKKLSEEASDEELLEILSALGREPMTIGILRETKIGIVVSKVKKSTADNSAANKLSEKFIQDWKKIAAAARQSAAESPRDSNVSEPIKAGKSVNEQVSVKISRITPTVSLGADVKLTTQSNKSVSILTDRLKLSCSEEQARDIALSIESAMFSELKDSDYTHKLRSIATNLKNNENLRDRLISGFCSPQELIHMRPDQMASEDIQKSREQAISNEYDARRTDLEFANEQRKKMQTALGLKQFDGTFQCRKCHSKDTIYHEQQTRSADEPMTIFITCMKCGTKRREG